MVKKVKYYYDSDEITVPHAFEVVKGKKKMEWKDMKDQFRKLNKLFTEIENRVLTHGPIQTTEVDALCESVNVSPTGYEVLAEYLKQSPKVMIETRADSSVWIIPNAEYREDQFPLDELIEE